MISQFPLVQIGKLICKVATCDPKVLKDTSIFEYVDISSINRETKRIEATSKLLVSEAPSRARQIINDGDILVSTVRPNLNAVAQVPAHLHNEIASTGFTVLRPEESKLDKRYLFHWVKNSAFVSYLEKNATGASYPAVTDKIVKDAKIPLPLLPEQKRIAEVLDKADALREKRRLALQKLDTLLQSVFLEMFGDPMKNPKGWERATIRDLVSSVNYGTSEKAGQDGEYPILRMNNITYQGGWNFTDLKYIDLSEKDRGKYLVKKGDILFNRTNSKELVGKTAVYREDNKMAFAGYLIRVRTNAENNPEYISAFLNSKYGKLILNNMCKSIIGMANINAQELQDISLPKPPIELQNKFASIVEQVEKTKTKLSTNLETVENLFQSLQQRAFKGELFSDNFSSAGN